MCFFFFFQAEDGIRDDLVTGVQTCALPISHLTRNARPGTRPRPQGCCFLPRRGVKPPCPEVLGTNYTNHASLRDIAAVGRTCYIDDTMTVRTSTQVDGGRQAPGPSHPLQRLGADAVRRARTVLA